MIETIKIGLKAEQTFAESAQKYSHAPSAQAGGDMGFAPFDWIEPTLYKTALHLKIDQVSDVLETLDGYVLIKLTGKHSWDDADKDHAQKLASFDAHSNIYQSYLKKIRAEHVKLPG